MKRVAALTLIAAGLIIFGATASRALVYAPEMPVAPPEALAAKAAQVAPSTVPSRIEIPVIGVDAKVLALGVVAGGRIQAPSSFTAVGWFKYGVAPGQPGTAVMYAHLDNGLGLSGVFKDLDKLQPGDELIITDASGQARTFIVSDMTTYPYNAIPPQTIGEGPDAQHAKAQVVLITCAGEATHDPVMGYTYDHRLLVTATLQS